MLLAKATVILCMKSWSLAAEEGSREGESWPYHILSRIRMMGLYLIQPILSYNEKRQGISRAFQLEVGGSLELLILIVWLSIVAEQNIQNTVT